MVSLKIQHGLFGGMFWLLCTISIADGLEMYTNPKYLATCGENVTLECDVEAEDDLDLKGFFWIEKKDICHWAEETNQTDFECRSISYKKTMRIYNFSLTIFNVQPKHKGTYHCKLRSKEGMKNGKTILRVQKCVGDSTFAVTTDEGTCTFKDVFPKPSVAWNQGHEDLTNLATTEVTNNTEGLFTAVSTIKLKKDPSNTYRYNCSLMMPIENEMNETVVQAVRNLNFSGGNKVIAHWFGIMLAMFLWMSFV